MPDLPPPMNSAQINIEPPPDPLLEEPPLNAAGRPTRKKRLTWKLLQQLPTQPASTPTSEWFSSSDLSDTAPPLSSSNFGNVWEVACSTVCNSFGLYREYPSVPTHNPDASFSLQVADYVPSEPTRQTQSTTSLPFTLDGQTSNSSPYFPFKNSTISGLMNWMWTGSATKSITEVNRLVDFLKSDQFNKEDLAGFDMKATTGMLDRFMEGSSGTKGTADSTLDKANIKDGWRESDVVFEVPDLEKHKPNDIPTFTVSGLLHRSIVNVIKSAFSDPASRSFHYTPFRSYWCSNSPGSEGNSSDTESNSPDSESRARRVFDELYSSDAMIDAHIKLQKQTPEQACNLERIIAGMMLWSDSTHLASFGTASLWPIYLYFGNQSKWVRGKPKAAACHHIAYIPKVSFLSWSFSYYEVSYPSSWYCVLFSCHLIFWTHMSVLLVMDQQRLF